MRKSIGFRLAPLALAGLGWWVQSAAVSAQNGAGRVEFQPLAAHARRVSEALDFLGTPLGVADRKQLLELVSGPGSPMAIEKIRAILDRRCLFQIQINPESRVKVVPGPARPELVEGGWRTFLARVDNEAGVTAALAIESPNARPLANSPKSDLDHRWLEIQPFTNPPLRKELSGLEVEYRVISLYSRDAGKREAKLGFNVGQGTQDLGFRSDADVLFTAVPAREIKLRVQDENGKPTTACFEVRDNSGRVYPSQAKRLAPDFHFHPQVYRKDGESIRLPAGSYQLQVTRGPEYVPQSLALEVKPGVRQVTVKLSRWIDPAAQGWFSGDHHIHAAGCAHYTNPSEGVHAPDMMRHCLGEDLKVGANLTWGPCFDYQKQFFTGAIDKVSEYPYLLRYDVEVSGFGSHQSGHLCLLRLKEQMYPGGTSKDHWPTLCLNTLKWAKKQGAVVGPAHTGWGLEVPGFDLPNYTVPKMDGIGANEYVADVTHLVEGPDGRMVPAVDFLSTVDTPYTWELNMWYHTLNCGYRTRISGETDFPCIYGERVGLGRSYVKLDGKLDYDRWCEGIRQGRNYVSDGMSHLLDFQLNGQKMGEGLSTVGLAAPGRVKVSVSAAARLKSEPDPSIKSRPPGQKPYWHLERARIGTTREVPVEVIVNGQPVAKQNIVADGSMRELTFDVPIQRSSWVAVRVLPSSHTNPIWVEVAGRPVRASRRSAEWCLQAVERCFTQKQRFIRASEQAEAQQIYDHARRTYRRILTETEVD